MTNLKSLTISYHFINDRQGRKQRMDAIIGDNWGQPVKEEWYKDAWRILTDVGIIFIVDMNCSSSSSSTTWAARSASCRPRRSTSSPSTTPRTT